MVHRCGLFCWIGGVPKKQVPLVNVLADMQVVDLTGQCTIVQEYFNDSGSPIEAVYLFPLDEKASVCEFQADIAGKIIEGVVKEKEEARREYQQAVSRGQQASLLEQKEADVFQILVGNIPAYSSAIIQITYVTELTNDDDKVRLVIPTYVAPRYTPHSSFGNYYRFPTSRLWPNRWSNSSSNAKTGVFNFQLECLMGSNILGISSTTHTISSSISGKTGTSQFVWQEALNRDLVVDIRIQEAHQPRFTLEVDPTDQSLAGMISIVPQFHLDTFRGEFIFIIDRSGSMSGKKMEDAKGALQLFLRSLPTDCYFNIIGFGSSFQSLHRSSVYYTAESLSHATSYVNSIQANLGGTEIASPLRSVFSTPALPGYSRQVFVITDGEVSNVSEVINLVRNNSKTARVFGLGIGKNVSRALVEGMARAGKGTSEYAIEGQSIQPVVIKQLKHSMQPSLENISIDWGVSSNNPFQSQPIQPNPPTKVAPKVGSLIGHRVNETPSRTTPPSQSRNDQVYQAPFQVPPIFSGNKMVVYAFFAPGVYPSTATITAHTPDGPLTLTLNPEKSDFNGRQIHVMGARALIRDLEEGSSHLHQGGWNPPLSQIRSEIIKLGTRFSLTSKYTSFVAVDKSANQSIPWWFNEPSVVTQTSSTMFFSASKSLPQRSAVPSSHRMYDSFSAPGGAPPQSFTMSYGAPAPPPPSGGAPPPSRGSSAFGGFFSSAPPPAPRKSRSAFGEEKKKKSSKEKSYQKSFDLMSESLDDSFEEEREALMDFDLSSSLSNQLNVASPQSNLAPSKLLDVVLLQNFDGSFDANSQVASSIGLSVEKVQNFGKNVGLPSGSIAVSLLVLAFFEEKMQHARNEWELVAEKCKKWLQTQGIDVQGMFLFAQQFIQQHCSV